MYGNVLFSDNIQKLGHAKQCTEIGVLGFHTEVSLEQNFIVFNFSQKKGLAKQAIISYGFLTLHKIKPYKTK